jgi:hypothetical protein
VNGLAPAPTRPLPWGAAELAPLAAGLQHVERRWQLLSDESTVTVMSAGQTLAEARVCEPDERVVLEFWVDPSGLPAEAIERLVAQAFAHPAVRARRPVLVCVAQRDGAVLGLAHRFVSDAVVRPAGVTCIIEGRVAVGVPSSAPPCPAT